MVKVIDDVQSSAFVGEGDKTGQEVKACYKCGSLLFYVVTEYKYLESKHATDHLNYCAVCGKVQSGITLDPFDELTVYEGVETLKIRITNKLSKTNIDNMTEEECESLQKVLEDLKTSRAEKLEEE